MNVVNDTGFIGLPPPSAIALLGMIVEAQKNDKHYHIDAVHLASKSGITRGPVNRDLRELEAHGYLKRQGSGQHRRWSSAVITKSGYDFVENSGLVSFEGTSDERVKKPARRSLQRTDYKVSGSVYSLTKKQHQTFFGIRDYIEEHGFFPGSTQLMKFLGLGQKSNDRAHVIQRMQQLESVGLIERVGEGKRLRWNKSGRLTDVAEKLIEIYPDEQCQQGSDARKQPVRIGGGVNPETGGTRFPDTLVSADGLYPEEILPRANSTGKLGSVVTIGSVKTRQYGQIIRTWSFEEGKTCNPECGLKNLCYMGKMSRQRRIMYEGRKTDIAFHHAMCEVGPSHYRITTGGDIPSIEFLEMFLSTLVLTKSTAFGFTHWSSDSELGSRILDYSKTYWDFFAVRYSYESPLAKQAGVPGAVTLPDLDEGLLKYFDAIPCPQQQGKAVNCGDCGLCWCTHRDIAFKLH